MIKVGDKVKFLGSGPYLGFENYKKCYGIVVEVKESGSIEVLIRRSFGRKHGSFTINRAYLIIKENYTKKTHFKGGK